MSRPRDTLTWRATPIRARPAAWKCGVEGQHCEADHTSGKRMKNLLDVLVLLELVDEGEHFRGLLFG